MAAAAIFNLLGVSHGTTHEGSFINWVSYGEGW